MPHQGSPFTLPNYTSGVPKVHHHLSWTGFNGRPFKTPLSSEENTFFMSTHKLCLLPFSRLQSLSHFAMRPVSPRFPRLWKWLGLNEFISPHVSLQLLHLSRSFRHSFFYNIKRRKLKSWWFSPLSGVKNQSRFFLSDLNLLSHRDKRVRQPASKVLRFPLCYFNWRCFILWETCGKNAGCTKGKPAALMRVGH